ncbi:MAG: hypothetical protein WBA97_08545 [Actinophytocola sp.]|uniref:hypothetical protein n=1 Tax=Actinophytocola sp. TaxID=1872138 RepID=UPI003C7929F1
MRIWGVLIPPGHLRWAAAGTGVVVLGVLIAVLVNTVGLFDASQEDVGTKTRASVLTGVSCAQAGATETVSFKAGGKDHRARFDGCGHAKGEVVEVTVPTGPLGAGLVVHAADAAVGDSQDGEGLGLLLIVVSGMSGAGYAFLLRRGPRTTRLPNALRMEPRVSNRRGGQETSAGGDSHVLHW